MRILCIVGTRPNFVKMAALFREMNRREGWEPLLVHTGQHYDDNMSKVFFTDLGLPRPDVDLDVSGGSYVSQTCRIMQRIEEIIADYKPGLVIVVGDVNSTLAGSIAAMQTMVPLAHVEAGLRSFDRTMPEETNRVVIDHIADYLFVTEQSGIDNLRKEGISSDRIHFVGNVMVDTLLANLARAKSIDILSHFGLKSPVYGLATLHRPANSDTREALAGILGALAEISRDMPLVLPLHPRTKRCIGNFGIGDMIDNEPGLYVTEPFGYLEFLSAMANASVVLTDSGGIQEETTVLGVPCITMRNNTERPVTIEYGTNTLAGTRREDILRAYHNVIATPARILPHPPLWDGKAAERIMDVLERLNE